MFAQATIVAIFAGLAAAQHTPVGEPSGNAITRPLNEIVPACKAFTITWQPSTPNSVSLVLLRGPSTNVVPLSTIVTGIANSGSFVWTPASSLEADTTHYGLQLIDDITGQYQYSTQFGISKGAECSLVVSSSAAASSVNNGGYYPVASTKPASSIVKSASSTVVSVSSAAPYGAASSSKVNITTLVTKSAPVVLSTGVPVANSTIVLPSKSMSVPSSLLSSATSTRSALPESTGAASSLQAGFSLAGVVAAFAFML